MSAQKDIVPVKYLLQPEIKLQFDTACETHKDRLLARDHVVDLLIAAKEFHIAEDIAKCSNIIHFGRDKSSGRVVRLYADACNNRFCPICAHTLAMKKSMKAWYKIAGLLNYHYLAALMETDTNKIEKHLAEHFVRWDISPIANVPGDQVKQAIKDINKMSHDWKKLLFFNPDGAIRSVELTYNEDTHDYHPHLHYFLYYKDGVPAQLRAGEAAFRDVFWKHKYYADDLIIRQASRFGYKSFGISKVTRVHQWTMSQKVLQEVCKYPVKFSDYSQCGDLILLMEQLKCCRMTTFTGALAWKESDQEEYLEQKAHFVQSCDVVIARFFRYPGSRYSCSWEFAWIQEQGKTSEEIIKEWLEKSKNDAYTSGAPPTEKFMQTFLEGILFYD